MASRMPSDGRIQMDMDNMRNVAAFQTLWLVYAKNISGSTITNTRFVADGTADYGTYTGNGYSVNNGARFGSLDPYPSGRSNSIAPTADSTTYGAHGVGRNGLTFYAEAGNVGLNIQIGSYW